jgi:hypothetical protein
MKVSELSGALLQSENANHLYCLGSCMSYCSDCKWKVRWDEVGEFTKDERDARWPDLVRVSNERCQLTNGSLFKVIEES